MWIEQPHSFFDFLLFQEQLGDEIDAALFPTFDYGFGQYNDFSSSPLVSIFRDRFVLDRTI